MKSPRHAHTRWSVISHAIESLESRQLLASPVIDAVPDQMVLVGKSLILPLTASDADGGRLSWTVTSSNPLLTPVLHTNNPWLKISVAGQGEMVLQMLADVAPKTVAYIGGLAQAGFYDGVIFHRVIPNFMIQGGDPLGTGTGGPGFQFDDEFNADALFTGNYQLAMAKSDDDTNGSQFFITTTQTRWLDFNHTIFGQLVRGAAVAEAISNVPRDANNKPLTDVVITSARYVDNLTDAVITLKAASALTGSTTITLTATDEQGNQTQQTFTVNAATDVNNTQPWFGAISNPVAPANAPITIPLPVNDLENSPWEYWGQFYDQASADAVESGQFTENALVITPKAGYTGPLRIVVYVSQDNWNNYDTQLIHISVGDQAITPTAGVLNAIAGVGETFLAGSFSDPDPAASLADYTGASINWGDGTITNSATIAMPTAGQFTVSGTHTYARSGVYPVIVTLTSTLGQVATVTGTATVHAMAPHERPSATITGAIPGATPASPALAYVGDGTRIEILLDENGGYSFSHIFADNGSYTVAVAAVSDGISAPLQRVLV